MGGPVFQALSCCSLSNPLRQPSRSLGSDPLSQSSLGVVSHEHRVDITSLSFMTTAKKLPCGAVLRYGLTRCVQTCGFLSCVVGRPAATRGGVVGRPA